MFPVSVLMFLTAWYSLLLQMFKLELSLERHYWLVYCIIISTAVGTANVWTDFLTFYFYLYLERTAWSCSPLEHSQNSPMQKCCVSRWAPSEDVHSTPTFWCQRVPERGIPTKDRSLPRGMIQCLTFAALPWQKTVFIHPPLQRRPLSFTCSYVLTYELKCNDYNLLYWIIWLDISLHIRVENVMDHEFHCKGYCVRTVNNWILY